MKFFARADRRALRTVLLGTLVAAPVLLIAQSTPGRPFTSGVELVALNVVATDAQKRFVRGLGSADFAVLEDGVPQPITFFADAQLPLDLIVLLDTSSSMTDKTRVAERAAAGFLRTLRPGDRGAVIGFADRACVLQALTDDVDALVASTARAQPDGSTALYSAIYVALKDHGGSVANAGEIRRRAMVVLSDGFDTQSPLPLDVLLDEVRRAGITVYTVLLESRVVLPSALTAAASEAHYSMGALAREAGGQPFFVREAQELEGVYARIADELANQYAIAYAPAAVRGPGLRRIEVQIPSRAGVRVRTRASYLAGQAATSDR